MSGTSASWTPERRRAQGKRMKKRMRDKTVRAETLARLEKANSDPANRAAASVRMKQLNNRMSTDDKLKAKCVRGQKRVRQDPTYRAIQSAVMTDIMSRPENKAKARNHVTKLNKDPEARRRQWAGRRRKKKVMEQEANEDMIEGYRDGMNLENPEPSANRSESYRHGFANARADREHRARATPAELHRMADAAMERDRSA